MYVNIDSLGECEMEFTKATQYADNALSFLNTIVIPDNFQYEQEIKKITTEVNSIREESERIKKVIAEKKEDYITVENNNIKLIDDLLSRMTSINIGLDTNATSTGDTNVGLSNVVSGTNLQNTTGGSVQGILEISNSTVAQGMNNILQFNNGQVEGYTEIQNSLMDVYKIKDASETSKILSLMSTNNQINDYAVGVEKVLNNFGDRTKEFKEQFGFDYYREGESGESIPNVELIYADLFLNINSDLLVKDTDGNNIVNPTMVDIDQIQGISLKSDYSIKSNASGAIDTYLKTKGIM